MKTLIVNSKLPNIASFNIISGFNGKGNSGNIQVSIQLRFYNQQKHSMLVISATHLQMKQLVEGTHSIAILKICLFMPF